MNLVKDIRTGVGISVAELIPQYPDDVIFVEVLEYIGRDDNPFVLPLFCSEDEGVLEEYVNNLDWLTCEKRYALFYGFKKRRGWGWRWDNETENL